MSNKSIVAIVVIVLLLAGGILWLVPFGNPAEENDNEVVELPGPEVVRVNHFFENGLHTVEGTITLPTPCYSLETNVAVTKATDDGSDKAVLNFVATSGTGVCTQVIADKFFSTSFEAGENAEITATYNGKPIRLDIAEGVEGSAIEKL